MSASSQAPIDLGYAVRARTPKRRLPFLLFFSLLVATVANASISIAQKIIEKDESNTWTGFSTLKNYDRLFYIGLWVGRPAVLLSIAALIVPSRSRLAGLVILALNLYFLGCRDYMLLV